MSRFHSRRKPVGPELKVALEQDLIDALTINAKLLGISRAALIRQLVRAGIDRLGTTEEEP